MQEVAMGFLRGLFRLLLWLVGLFLGLQVVLRLVRRLWPQPMPSQLGTLLLESPLRKRLLSAEALVQRMGLAPGQTVLEVGAGTGYVAMATARAVGEAGKVYTVDVEPQMVERLSARATAELLANLRPTLGDAGRLTFADDTFDVVYFVTSLGEMPDKRAPLWEAYRVLKPGGTLSVTEVLLDPDYMRRGTVIRYCEEAGFYLVEEIGNVLAYTLNFRKPPKTEQPGG